MTIEMRKCPICGKKPKYYPPDCSSKGWYECTHKSLPPLLGETFVLKSNYFPTKDEALEDWNIRAENMLSHLVYSHVPLRKLIDKHPEYRDKIVQR